MRVVLLFLLILFPTLSVAGGVFSVPATDKSMQYLGMVFGSVAGLPIQTTGSALFTDVVYVFNNVIFALSIVIISFTTIIGSVNTAHEGQFLGKKWHPILLPLRSALGLYLLIPVAGNGYNWIQVTVMWFIVQGVGAANSIWSQAMSLNKTIGSIHNDAPSISNEFSSVASIFKGVVCMEEMNQMMQENATINGNIGSLLGTFWFSPDTIGFGRIPVAGQAGDAPPLCGSITIPKLSLSLFNPSSSSASDALARQTAIGGAIISIAATLRGAALEALNQNPNTYSRSGDFYTAALTLQTAAANVPVAFSDLDSVQQDAIKDGWIHAGSYYFQLISGSSSIDTSVDLTYSGVNTSLMKTFLGDTLYSATSSTITDAASNYKTYVYGNYSPPATAQNGALRYKENSRAGDRGGTFLSSILGNLMEDITNQVNNTLTQCSPITSVAANPVAAGLFGIPPTQPTSSDPLLCMAKFGSTLAVGAEFTFWTALLVVFGIWVLGSFESMNPLADAMNFTLAIVVPLACIIIGLIWVVGITFALYVPLIPYLVFLFSAVSWLILVIEAMLAAPMIALTLIVPSEDEIGKAGHAMVILLGLFFRPALMILGFILAIKLLTIAIDMLNFGFWSTIADSTGGTGGIGVFGMIAIIFIYAALAVGMVHEAFSLIYVIPDKALRWMGGQEEHTDIDDKVKGLKGSVESGAQMGAGMMKSGLSAAGDKAKAGGGGGGMGM